MKRARPAGAMGIAVAVATIVSAQVSTGVETSGTRPGWLTRYLEEPLEAWDGWRNTLAPEGEPAGPLALAENGRADYVIVVPESATPEENKAAEELQVWLDEMTGARFRIVSDSAPARERELSVGRTNRAEAAGLLDAHPDLGEGYVIEVEGERVYLLGGERPGPLHAVYALLEEDLGCRWYSPDESRIPHTPDLVAGIVPRTYTPPITVRNIRSVWDIPWSARNRLSFYDGHWHGADNEGFPESHGFAWSEHVHNTLDYLVPHEKYFDDHPEYYSLIDGERRHERGQLCLSNPDIPHIAARRIIHDIDKGIMVDRRGRTLVGGSGLQRWQTLPIQIGARDYRGGNCQCDDCREMEEKFGSLGGLYLHFTNQVADLIQEEYPDAKVALLVYVISKEPPTLEGFRASENVTVLFCSDFGADFDWPYHSYEDEEYGRDREHFHRWMEIIDHPPNAYVYPNQYRNYFAPEPNIHAMAENIRFFAEHGTEYMHVHQGNRSGWDGRRMSEWMIQKLLWNPRLDVNDLMLDFIWGYYGDAAPAVAQYHDFLLRHLAEHGTEDGEFKKLGYIYPIHDLAFLKHGFVEEARAILGRALEAAENEDIRRRVKRLTIGVVYVEAVHLFMQMYAGDVMPCLDRYDSVGEELAALCRELTGDTTWLGGLIRLAFYDGSVTVRDWDDWLKMYESEKIARTVAERWHRKIPVELGRWEFRKDPDDRGLDEGWCGAAPGERGWVPVPVPAFLADTDIGPYLGYGWYRTVFDVPERYADRPVLLDFGAVDEQAWIYVNGDYAGEHTEESEGAGAAGLWNRPFAIRVAPEHTRVGENVLTVRMHASRGNAGIHKPVSAWIEVDAGVNAASDGSIVDEDFENVEVGEIPGMWERNVLTRDGTVHGIAEVSDYFYGNRILRLRDQQAHIAVWSVSDSVLPADNRWAVQFDFRLGGTLKYGYFRGTTGTGALFGLKRGRRRGNDFLPVVFLDNENKPGAPVSLVGLGEVIETDLAPHQWHRLVIRRDGTDWHFYLNDELKKTVRNVDTDYRGYAFGSFHHWTHVAQEVYYDNFKIGRFMVP